LGVLAVVEWLVLLFMVLFVGKDMCDWMAMFSL
jgi:hypothetical protein